MLMPSIIFEYGHGTTQISMSVQIASGKGAGQRRTVGLMKKVKKMDILTGLNRCVKNLNSFMLLFAQYWKK